MKSVFFIVLVSLSLSGCRSEVLQDENYDDDNDDGDVREVEGEGGDKKKQGEVEKGEDERQKAGGEGKANE